MNWGVRVAVFTGLILAISLPIKWAATVRSPDASDQAVILREFLERRHGLTVSRVQPNPSVAEWVGWRFTAGRCDAVAMPDYHGAEGALLLNRLTAAGRRIVFLYRGRASPDYGQAHTLGDRIAERLLGPLRPSWSHMVVVLALTGDCAPVLGWDWTSL